jgi:NAD(P)-dependent dehydrogenase (short-subunit alcohol dehydrogenase family)
MESVEGKVGVITGAASGIGLGIARAFTGAGMRVVLSDNRADALDAAVKDLEAQGHAVVGVPADVSKLSEVEALAEAALDSFGAVDVLCNNAGVGLFKPVAKTSIEDWEWTLAIDLWGPIHGVKTFLPVIERQPEGHINSTSSMAGLLAVRALGAYNVAKHGVVALMATLQRELRAAHSPVYTSVLCPGAVNTGIGRNSVDSRRASEGRAPTSKAGDGRSEGEVDLAGVLDAMDPDEVGRLVLDAVLTNRFWVFTDPRMLASVQDQVEAMLEDGALSRLRMV